MRYTYSSPIIQSETPGENLDLKFYINKKKARKKDWGHAQSKKTLRILKINE